ncbi:hypothetical protein HBI64_236390 [Parastagonospora nodorum]|nr:hypothetical protein HBI64_236390 [Parastagonospora nodorum]
MCAKDDLIRRKGPLRLAGELATAESVTAKDPNHVDTFGSDFAFSFAAWLQRIKCMLGDVDSLFADARLHDLHTRLLFQSGRNTDYPVRVYHELHSRDCTLLAGFIPTTKIRDPLLKSQVYYYCIGKLLSQNAAKSGILLACADGRTRQCYLTICAILADYEEQVLLTGIKKNRYCTRCTRTEQFTQLQQERCLDKGHDDFVHLVNCFRWKHYNFNIHVSLATDTLHLLLKGLVMKMLDFMQDMLDDIYPGSRKTWDNSTTPVTQESGKQKAIIQQLVAVVSLLFVSKAPFALHFIYAVCDLVTLAQYKSHDEDTLAYIQGALERMNVFKEEFQHALTHIIQDIRMYRALDSICTRANSEAHYITMVKQFYSMTNKKEYILQICLHNSQRTALLAADYATVVKQTAVFVSRMSVQIHPSIKCWRSSSKRHNDPEHCDEEVVRCVPNWQQTGLWRRDYVWVQEFEHRDNRRQSRTVTDDRKHIAYIGAFSEVLLFNNNGQIDNTTRMLSMRRRAWNAASKRRTLQAFKFYDLSTIIRLVHLVPRDLPDSTTRTTMSYYVNNYINWDEYNRLYSLTFNIDLLRTLREYRRKQTQNN